ncbi:UNVERIFIED_CONTAM: Retrovirus-related Pol polyprotein from type-2 retrotransposable element R2DM [Sesamum radiatum]|uniref:Retrovirus-related Pol polyprotein from type-2 retrotransposable element R2DM n=1 Tax=Sesamum radiatum TaxID=300843 RepID=A0AAW2J9T4_SESRA
MDDSLKTMAPPLLECQTELPCSKVEIVAVQQPEASVTAATRGRVEMRCPPPRVVPAATGTLSPMSSTGIFIGNVPLHTPGSDFSCDKFAASFNNSTRKTLSYVSPSIQNGEIVVRPSIDVVREGSRRWDNTAVGYFLGRKPYYHHLNEYVRSVWPAIKMVTATSNGFYFFQFKTEIAMEEVIEGGPWLFQGQPIVLQRWEPGMVLRKHKHTQVPVWIRLRHLPVEFWTDDGLSTVASGVGRPLYQDTITRACTRLDFARVCVMLDISSTLPKHLIIMMPREDGTEVPCKVEVEYEWVPPKCKNCMSLGHSTSACPDDRKIDKPPVSVYVQKRTVQPSVSRPDVTKGADRNPSVAREDGAGRMQMERHMMRCFRPGSYKQPLAYCYVMNAAIWNVRGLNRRDHQVAVKELVSEFRLQFLGLLETRVSAVNVSRIQKFLPHWSWFTDYNGPGNRIWLAWDDELLDVHVLDLDVQFIHCRITIRCAHLSVLATVVYGANDTIGRRGLWQNLMTLAHSISDEPWIVGGDFNTVLDMSEVCGSSADIQLAMTEFRDCILDTGLIHLPVQGERFSWHNCSEGDRSLWKRLDRLIVNDAWLGRWPCSHYHCLNARTSDHSPLVIRGDTVSHKVSMFRFDNYLTMSSEFTTSVQNIWRHQIAGTYMYAVTRKLRALKQVFRTLRKKKGDLSLNVKLAAEFLGTVQKLLQTDRHNTLLIRLEKCCKMVFFRATKLEQVMLQQRAKIQWLKGGDQCSRIFFRKVAMRRASKKVFQIANEAGRTLTEQDEVVDEFVSFYQRLLGGERRREYIDLRYLRPWARHVVTPAECTALVQRPTREEVKDAFFDIAEDKAPGPDGYSSGFYKAAWPVIGDEVVKAIMEFFTTGRLLKQVNTTMLALIPKRLRLVLDAMISPSQNAFVPGRSIGDNILLAQEMFTGCAPAVWIPDIFIGWIEECVTTPMFSVCINGNPHGFFKGARGLRQGDPMSPFLFVLVMEVLQLMLQQLIDQNEGFSYHWRCKELGLFQLCFADDLLLFCKADVASIQVFRRGLEEFANLSGLHANPQKSQLIISRSAQEEREHLIAALQFQEGHPPSGNQSSIWVRWIAHNHLRHKSVWTVDVKGGSWGWRKLLRLRSALLPHIDLKIGDGESFSLWHDPWHSLGPLIQRFPCGPSRTNIPAAATLSTVIVDGAWCWPLITDMECIEIIHVLPTIHNGSDSILWRGGDFSTKVVYDISGVRDLRWGMCVADVRWRHMSTYSSDAATLGGFARIISTLANPLACQGYRLTHPIFVPLVLYFFNEIYRYRKKKNILVGGSTSSELGNHGGSPSQPSGLASQDQELQEAAIPQDCEDLAQLGDLEESAAKESRATASSSPLVSKSPPTAQEDQPEQPVIYVGKVKLQATSVDSIAGAFLQSSRKTLHFVPPTKQNGKLLSDRRRRWLTVVPRSGSLQQWAIFLDGGRTSRRWNHLLARIGRVTACVCNIQWFLFFRFCTRFAMEEVIEGGPCCSRVSLSCFRFGSRACPCDGNSILKFQFGSASSICRWNTGRMRGSARLRAVSGLHYTLMASLQSVPALIMLGLCYVRF